MKLKLSKNNLPIILIFITLLVNISQSLTVHFIWLPFLAIGLVYLKNRRFTNNGYLFCAIAFELFLIASYSWSYKSTITVTGARSILTEYSTVLFVMLIVACRFKDSNRIHRLIVILNLSTLVYCAYVFAGTPLSDWGRIYIGDTIGIGKNAVGMRCAWGMLYAFYLIKTSKKKMFYLLSISIFTLFVAFSGSRKAILIAVVGIAMFQLFCGGTRKLPRNILIGVVILSVSLYLIYNNSLLYSIIGNRMESTLDALFRGGSGDGSMQERSYYKLQAMSMFYAKPILGFGINGFMARQQLIGYFRVAYSHCNYTELLANYGLIGFLLFYAPRFYLAIRAFIKKLYKKDLLSSLFFVAVIVQLVMDYEMVSYYNLFPQLIFCVAFSLFDKETNSEQRDHSRERMQYTNAYKSPD